MRKTKKGPGGRQEATTPTDIGATAAAPFSELQILPPSPK